MIEMIQSKILIIDDDAAIIKTFSAVLNIIDIQHAGWRISKLPLMPSQNPNSMLYL
jgi:hypothetical protein